MSPFVGTTFQSKLFLKSTVKMKASVPPGIRPRAFVLAESADSTGS